MTSNNSDNENQEYSCELKFAGSHLEDGNNYLCIIKVTKTELNVESSSIANRTDNPDESEAKSE